MRLLSMLLPAFLFAAPAIAQAPASAPSTSAIEALLDDPATADRIAGAMHGVSKALLNVPVGELEAAIEGHPPTAADKQRTLRDVGRAQDPDFERTLDRQLADSRGALRSGMKAMAAALPAMSKAVADLSREMERTLGNLPRPNYPNR